MNNYSPSENRAQKPAGQCAYEKFQQSMDREGYPHWDTLDLDEREAWSLTAVEGYKKITEANTKKVFLT